MFAEWSSTLVRSTAWLSFAFYIATLYGWLRWHSSTATQQRLRCLWSLGCIVFIIHTACAFHLVHHWSHRAAWEATRLQGGYGDGVYLNYLVLIVWLADVLWWWLAPDSSLRRAPWIQACIQGFLLFMWFNAAVVFAQAESAAIGIVGFTLLAIGILQKYRQLRQRNTPA